MEVAVLFISHLKTQAMMNPVDDFRKINKRLHHSYPKDDLPYSAPHSNVILSENEVKIRIIVRLCSKDVGAAHTGASCHCHVWACMFSPSSSIIFESLSTNYWKKGQWDWKVAAIGRGEIQASLESVLNIISISSSSLALALSSLPSPSVLSPILFFMHWHEYIYHRANRSIENYKHKLHTHTHTHTHMGVSPQRTDAIDERYRHFISASRRVYLVAGASFSFDPTTRSLPRI